MTIHMRTRYNSNRRATGTPVLGSMAAVLVLATSSPALAGATIKIGEEQSISVGMGLRASVTQDSDGAPDGGDAFDANLDSVRLYLKGQITDKIGATFNTEYVGSTGEIKVLDAFVRLEFNEHFNVWAGQLLPPSDRANLDGPYYLNSYSYPGLVSQYPAKYAGRDNGVTIWGSFANRKLSYAAGVFRGHNRIAGASNEGGKPLFAGRVAYNFWEVEDNPGYWTSSTYYGSANILTLAVAGMYQKDGVGTALNRGDYKAWNVDALMERKVGDGGAVTLEGAYYQYRTGGVADVPGNFAGAGATDNVGGIGAGDAWLVSAGFLVPTPVGPGRIQPVLRYQQFDPKYAPGTSRQYNASLNYIIKGHNARLSLDYAHAETTGAPDRDRVTLGIQLQF